MKQKVFVDTNIVLDMLMKRVPFFQSAERLFEQGDEKRYELYVSTVSFTTVHHQLLKKYGRKPAMGVIRNFRKRITLLRVDSVIIDHALHSDFDDFEDAVQYHCSVSAGMNTIITRDTKDYRKAKIPVKTADAFLEERYRMKYN
jgi:predicted nucleic acid-binding protein